jgi:hypothetical protein
MDLHDHGNAALGRLHVQFHIRFSVRSPVRNQSAPILEIVDELNNLGGEYKFPAPIPTTKGVQRVTRLSRGGKTR